MKFLTQKVIPVIVLIGMVGGITFVSQWVNTSPTSVDNQKKPQPVSVSSPQLKLSVTNVEPGSEWEVNSPGHYDIWWENHNPVPLQFGVDRVSCKCTNILILPLTEHEKEFKELSPVAGASEVMGAAHGFASFLGIAAAATERVEALIGEKAPWQSLNSEATPIATLPPDSVGLLRMRWDPKKIAAERLKARVWTQVPGDVQTRKAAVLEIPVSFVSPVRFYPKELKLPGDLEREKDRSVDFLCWSATRAGFELTAKEATSDPCFACTCMPLTEKEYQDAAALLNAQQKTQVRSGYHVAVKVHERVPGRQMDLGPFVRDLVLSTDTTVIESFTVPISGIVRGEIQVGTPDEPDTVALHSFVASRGTNKTIPVEATQLGVKVEFECRQPDFLEVKLVEAEASFAGGTRWDLSVTVPPNRANGHLPADSAVFLRILGESPRRIRIPVTGNATVPLK